MGRAGGAATTFSAMVAGWRARSEPALIAGDEVWSGPEMLRRAAGTADWLDGAGLPPGRPVPALVATGP
ncbi:MAG TPA: long-chain fatty acid--CoA ligase, partial [Acidimicrobiia bacterium]|nr:long-chain fatty acid--CoA ligase [Acidimicrobiia bacterium]